jgi:nucleotide-binding universal stress UspA family protein
MKRSLVVGVDASDESLRALARATELARLDDLCLVVVYVRDVPVLAGMSSIVAFGAGVETADQVESMAQRAAAERLRGAGVEWVFVVRSGDPARQLMAEAVARSAPAVVVGGRPHSAPVSALLGSVATSLVHHFHGSVLVVRGDDSEWYESLETRTRLSTEKAIDAIYGERIEE